MPDEKCRLAKAENEINNINDKLDEIIDSIKSMKEEQTRYKGFIGGVVFTVGALFSFFAWWTGSK